MVNIAILCEGVSDREFFEMLIQYLVDSESIIKFDKRKINFYIFGGKSKFFELNNTRYKDLKLEIDNGQIEKVLFVVDADNEKNDAVYGGLENTQSTLNNAIKQLGIEAISHTYIMCHPETKSGYLESLILASLPEEKRLCIEGFVKCSGMNPKLTHKRIINHLYTIVYSDPPYNFDHPHFALLKDELINLFK